MGTRGDLGRGVGRVRESSIVVEGRSRRSGFGVVMGTGRGRVRGVS